MGTFHTFKWVLIIWSSSLVLTGLILLSSSAFIVHQAGFHKYQRLFTLLLMLSTRDQSLELLLKVITTNLYPLVANWKEEDIKMDDLLSSQDDTGLLASQATGYLLAYLFCSVIRTWHIVAIILIFASLILIGTTSIIATYLQGRRLLLVSSGALIALLIGVSFAHNLVMDWQPMAHLSLVEFLMVKVSKEFQLQPSSFPDVSDISSYSYSSTSSASSVPLSSVSSSSSFSTLPYSPLFSPIHSAPRLQVLENSPLERKHERILQVPPNSATLNFSESIFLGEDIEPGYAVIDAGANGTRADCNLNDNEGGRKCGVCIGKLPPFQLLWDNIQTWERCCGVLSFRDYIPIRRIPQSGNAMIPPTCCHNPKNEDCQRNPNLFNSYIAWSCDMAIWNRIAESYEFVVTCLSFFQFYLCIFVILLVMAALLA